MAVFVLVLLFGGFFCVCFFLSPFLNREFVLFVGEHFSKAQLFLLYLDVPVDEGS